MTRVFVAQHPAEAHLVAGLLTSQGIPVEVQGEALFSARGGVPVTPATLPSVWVLNDEDVESALEILARRAASPAGITANQPWKCSRCGQTIEPQFTECWSCGNPRS